MSATTGGPYSAAPEDVASTTEYDDDTSGWVLFAGTMLAIVGVLNFIYGIAAIDAANFYVANAQYVFSDLSTWGWVMLLVGALQFAAACGLFLGASWGRWVGIATASLNAIAQLMWIDAAPWLAVALFAVDIIVLYGLVAHGGRRHQTV